MKINVKDNHQNLDSDGVGNYTLEVDDNKVINSMTTKSPIYYYALINGKLFKSEQYKGLKSYLFNTKEKLEKAIAGGLIGKTILSPILAIDAAMTQNNSIRILQKTIRWKSKNLNFKRILSIYFL